MSGPNSWLPEPGEPLRRQRPRPEAHRAETPWAGHASSAPNERVDDDPLVRPFMLTGGRTQPLHDGLRIETLVSAEPAGLSAPLRFEARRIVELCQRPMAVADIAVALRAPLGIARVLVADLIAEGYLRCETQGEITTALIERIRDRVRAL